MHFRDGITPTVSDIAPTVITTSLLISYPILYYIISTFYEIIPTICGTSYTLYISYKLLMSSHYCVMTSQPLYVKPHPVCRATYALYM